MEIPVIHEHSRPSKKPAVSSRNVSRPTAPPPPARPGPVNVNGVSSSGNGAGKSRGAVQTIPFHKANDWSLETSLPQVKTGGTGPARGNAPPASAASSPSSSSSVAKASTKTATTPAKSATNGHFLKLAATRGSPGQKPKLPTKPAGLRENPTLILSRKSGTASASGTTATTTKTAAAAAAAAAGTAISLKTSTSSGSQPQLETSASGKNESIFPPADIPPETVDRENKTWFASRSLSSPAGKTAGSGPGLKPHVHGPPSRQTSLHARLPSTDSGIQADGGFDSLSRYKGKSFLSDSSATFDSLEGSDDVINNSCTSPVSTFPNVVEVDTTFCRNPGSVSRDDRNRTLGGSSKRKSLCTEVDGDQFKPELLGRKNCHDFQSITRGVDKKMERRASGSGDFQTTQPASSHAGFVKPASKRPFPVPRPVSSPPPAPVSAASSCNSSTAKSVPVVKRPPKHHPPDLSQPTWRHSAGPPSRSLHVGGENNSQAQHFKAMASDVLSGLSHKPFPHRTIKTSRSTSLENFSNILGENLSASANPNDSVNMSRISSSSKTGGVSSIPANTSNQAFTLPRSVTKASSHKHQAYMTVSPPPPPQPQHSALITTSSELQTNSSVGSVTVKTVNAMNTVKSDPVSSSVTVTSNCETSNRSSSPPKLHPSIKAFTNHRGAVHIASNKTPSAVLSNSPAKRVSSKQSLPSSTKEADSVNVDHPQITEVLYQNMDSLRNRDSEVLYQNMDSMRNRSSEVLYQNIESLSYTGQASEAQKSKHDPDTKVNGRVKGESNHSLTRPLRVVATPGKLDTRALQPTSLSPQLQTLAANLEPCFKDTSGIEEAKVESKQTSPVETLGKTVHAGQTACIGETRDKCTKPSFTPRSKVPLCNSYGGLSAEPVPQVRLEVESNSALSMPTNPHIVSPTRTIKESRGLDSSQRQSSMCSNQVSGSVSRQSVNASNRMEIPVTHIREEEASSTCKVPNTLSLADNTARSPSLETKALLHRSKDEIRKNVDGLRPLSLSFPHSPSLLSPSSHSATLPKNSTFKRDMRSPYRLSRQAEERQRHKDAVYENVRTRLRDSFRFDDEASRFRHADLLLKETDELMKEALEVLNKPSLPHPLSPSLTCSSPLTQRFFYTPMTSVWRRNRFRSGSSSEENECPKDAASVPKSPSLTTASSMTPQRSPEPRRHSGKENFNRNENPRQTSVSTSDGYKSSLSDFHVIKDETGTSIPFYDVRSGKFYDSGKDVTPNVSRDKVLPGSIAGDVTSPTQREKSRGEEVTWGERKARMDSALSWLKTELAALRDIDNQLICQFRRCQDTIETLKTQRDVWEGLSEEGEECDYWDDYEINEFNKKYLDSPGGSSTSQLSPGSRNSSLYDVTSATAPRLALPGERRDSPGLNLTSSTNGVTQDIEATV
ncbi:hypothetical protein ElyMa_005816000 [Elysia marginata]|uniref:Uncharacterized protein n=1 Tax=Elysia marginata TaxID=1093978 RepID=A0AAV4FW06_9GAST|nr:hypothetical protein ElyMa_005816000 [Elysia marginata]